MPFNCYLCHEIISSDDLNGYLLSSPKTRIALHSAWCRSWRFVSEEAGLLWRSRHQQGERLLPLNG